MKALATALAKAQAEIKAALKDSKNPHFKSSYADLTSVWDACRGALTKNGLSVVQKTDFSDGEVWLETIRQVEPPASTMAGRKVEADGARNAREFVNAEALPALAAMKTKADLDKWLKTHEATLNGIKKAFPEQYEALDARISKTLDRVHPLAAG